MTILTRMRRVRAALRQGAPSRAEARDHERLLLAVGALNARYSRSSQCPDIRSAEFRTFSQFGEDGIIQYLIARIPIANRTFVEIGVQDYRESNTRFLLMHDDWEGLIVDADDRHLRPGINDDLMWRHTLHRLQTFVTADNVNRVVTAAGFDPDLGLLSLDIDGNDYWVLKEIDAARPRILITEYNSLFGPNRAVTVPYRDDFGRFAAHFSGLYWGASLRAMSAIAAAKGYALVGSNSAGNNAFFVRDDVLGDLSPISAQEAWIANKYRDARDETGALSYVTGHERQRRLISDLPLVDVESGERIRVDDL